MAQLESPVSFNMHCAFIPLSSHRSIRRKQSRPSFRRRIQDTSWQAFPRLPLQAPAPEESRTAYRTAGLPDSGPGRRDRPPWIPGPDQVSFPVRRQQCRRYYFCFPPAAGLHHYPRCFLWGYFPVLSARSQPLPAQSPHNVRRRQRRNPGFLCRWVPPLQIFYNKNLRSYSVPLQQHSFLKKFSH